MTALVDEYKKILPVVPIPCAIHGGEGAAAEAGVVAINNETYITLRCVQDKEL